MNILVVEDDILIAEMIKEMLLELNHKVTSIAHNLVEAVSAIDNLSEIDMAILDIQLGDQKDGLAIAHKFNETRKTPFIFLTSYADKSVIDEALILKPKAYLLKPFTKLDLYTTLEIIQSQVEEKPKVISIKEGTKHIKLDISDILYIKSDNIYLEIFTKEKRFLIRNSLEKFLTELNDPRIKRVQRSYAININKIECVAGQNVIIENTPIPFSRSHKDSILNLH